MEKNDKPIPFEELYPDYPIKPVKKIAYLPGLLEGLAALTIFTATAVGLFYILSNVQVPLPAATTPKVPQTESEMMSSLPVEKLFEIAVNCMSVKDRDCAIKVFDHIMKVKPEFINSDRKRQKLMSEASSL